jgi:hypothetical protein
LRSWSNGGWWSLPEVTDPASHAVDGGTRRLSAEALSDLLEAVVARGVPFRFEARGHSMFPFIRNGDVVTVSALCGRRARYGEVVAFAGPGEHGLAVHRVVSRRADAYTIRADNAREPDGLVPDGCVLATVTGVDRRGRRIRLGLGPERALVATLSRIGVLAPLIGVVRGTWLPSARRSAG